MSQVYHDSAGAASRKIGSGPVGGHTTVNPYFDWLWPIKDPRSRRRWPWQSYSYKVDTTSLIYALDKPLKAAQS